MPPEPSDVGSPQDWLRHARADLALAETPSDDEEVRALLCFHLQQAVEKSLKAVLLESEIRFQPTLEIAHRVYSWAAVVIR